MQPSMPRDSPWQGELPCEPRAGGDGENFGMGDRNSESWGGCTLQSPLQEKVDLISLCGGQI